MFDAELFEWITAVINKLNKLVIQLEKNNNGTFTLCVKYANEKKHNFTNGVLLHTKKKHNFVIHNKTHVSVHSLQENDSYYTF